MNEQTIHVFAKWQVKAGHLDAVLALLPEVAQKSAAEPGNLYYQVYQDKTDPQILLLSEAYQNEDALNEHRNSAHYQTLVAGQIVPMLQNREVTLTHQLEL